MNFHHHIFTHSALKTNPAAVTAMTPLRFILFFAGRAAKCATVVPCQVCLFGNHSPIQSKAVIGNDLNLSHVPPSRGGILRSLLIHVLTMWRLLLRNPAPDYSRNEQTGTGKPVSSRSGGPRFRPVLAKRWK